MARRSPKKAAKKGRSPSGGGSPTPADALADGEGFMLMLRCLIVANFLDADNSLSLPQWAGGAPGGSGACGAAAARACGARILKGILRPRIRRLLLVLAAILLLTAVALPSPSGRSFLRGAGSLGQSVDTASALAEPMAGAATGSEAAGTWAAPGTAPGMGANATSTANTTAGGEPCFAPLEEEPDRQLLDSAAAAAAGGLSEIVMTDLRIEEQARLLPGGDLAHTPAGAAWAQALARAGVPPVLLFGWSGDGAAVFVRALTPLETSAVQRTLATSDPWEAVTWAGQGRVLHTDTAGVELANCSLTAAAAAQLAETGLLPVARDSLTDCGLPIDGTALADRGRAVCSAYLGNSTPPFCTPGGVVNGTAYAELLANGYDAMEGALRRQLQPNHGVAKDAHYRLHAYPEETSNSGLPAQMGGHPAMGVPGASAKWPPFAQFLSV